jgi:peptide/nickel transport system ATP-binding protein
MSPLLEVEDLVVRRRVGVRRVIEPVAGVSFELDRGGAFGVVGESGCGKSTLARALVGLLEPSSGSVRVAGRDVARLDARARRELCREVQMVFQDPVGSLNPRRTAVDAVAEPLRIWHEAPSEGLRATAARLLGAVGLDADHVGARRPRELSGGQCQRVSIARALALGPRLLVCDEATSSLDVSAQAQVLELFRTLRERGELALVLISHDLAVVRQVCDRVGVMYLGRLCELAPAERIFTRPRHPYTAALAAAARKDTGALARGLLRPGEVPSFLSPPSGCRFRTRCARAQPACAARPPALRELAPGHLVACHFPLPEREASTQGPAAP